MRAFFLSSKETMKIESRHALCHRSREYVYVRALLSSRRQFYVRVCGPLPRVKVEASVESSLPSYSPRAIENFIRHARLFRMPPSYTPADGHDAFLLERDARRRRRLHNRKLNGKFKFICFILWQKFDFIYTIFFFALLLLVCSFY